MVTVGFVAVRLGGAVIEGLNLTEIPCSVTRTASR